MGGLWFFRALIKDVFCRRFMSITDANWVVWPEWPIGYDVQKMSDIWVIMICIYSEYNVWFVVDSTLLEIPELVFWCETWWWKNLHRQLWFYFRLIKAVSVWFWSFGCTGILFILRVDPVSISVADSLMQTTLVK